METLTIRENEVAGLVAHELAEKQIADKLCISEQTVHTHTKNIRKKLGCKNNVGIATRYILSLENPKAFIPGMFFLLLQLFMLADVYDYNARLVQKAKTSKVFKAGRGKGKRKEVDYV